MAISTTVGPLTEDTRDALKTYGDERGYPNYETTVSNLLKLVQNSEVAD
jgi:hypothetical protein